MSPTITPEEWARVKALFFAAQEAAPDERARLLGDEAVAEPLRAHAARLLDIADHAGGRFETPPAVALLGASGEPPTWADEARSLVGRRLGPYAVVRRVGVGGMGAIYEARRADGDGEPRVAVKTIAWHGGDADVLLRRFRSERRILAGLRHPNIAQLLDGGATEDGLPYLVMEFVDGEPIDRWCDARRLPIAERLALFRQVCAAVQHAHASLVVHRDLKPSNVFVAADGTVKLLDFGVAKLIGDAHADGTLTGAGLSPFTLAYAAPEQVTGGRVSIATDIYALGALLHVLLTGHPPFGADGLSPADAVAAIRDGVLVPPSAAATDDAAAAARGLPSAERLARALRGELDAIVSTALRKEPERRYATVDAMSEDVRRHLARERVAARPDTFGYRVRTFVRRRRALVAALVSGAAALVLGSGVALQQAARARQARAEAEARYADVRALAGTLLFDAYDNSKDVAGTTALQARIAERARAHLDALAAAGRRDPLLDQQLARAYRRLGDVRGNPTMANLGDVSGAREAYVRALALARRAAAALPADTSVAQLTAVLLERLADVEAPLGDPAGAVARLRQAVGLREAAVSRAPSDGRAALELAITLIKVGDLSGHPAFVNVGRPRDALDAYGRALARLDAPPLAADTSFGTRRQRALIRERVGRMLQALGDFGAAADTLRRSLRMRHDVLASRVTSVQARRDVAIGHFLLADVLLARGDVAAAAAHADSALPIRESLMRADPDDVNLVRGMALTLGQVARVRLAARDTAGARRQAEASLRMFDRYRGGRAPNAADRVEIERVRAVLAAAR